MAVQETSAGSADQPQLQAGGGNMDSQRPDSRTRGNQIWRGKGSSIRSEGGFIAASPPPPVSAEKPDRLVSYEVHFLRADGTLSLRLFTAAETIEEALLSVGKMQSGEFAAVRVWRSLDHAMVHHRPAHAEPAGD